MSSSTAGLARTRSLRRPAATSRDRQDGDQTRTTSPSRLPMVRPGAPRAAPATSSSSSSSSRTNNTKAAGINSTRPVSGVYSKPPLSSLTRQASTRQPGRPSSGGSSTTTSSTTTAAGRPNSSGENPPSATGRSLGRTHSRAKSSATALTSATTLRPPSTSASSTSSTTTTGAGSNNAAPGTRSRPLSLQGPPSHRRNASASTTTTAAAAAAASQHQQLAARPARPAFSTHQQHYSPAKSLAPKPLTATFLAPPSPSKQPANVALSAETARLQTELLQLHLLHRAAAPAAASWRASARASLGSRFASLGRAAADVARDEAAAAERANAAALHRWGDSGSGSGPGRLDDKVQTLDALLAGVWGVAEPGGRYARVARRFERWAARADDVAAARRRGNGHALLGGGGGDDDGDDVVVFVGEVDPGWRQECAALAHRLDGWRDQLRALGGAGVGGDGDGDGGEVVVEAETEPPSSLELLLVACTTLVDDMLAELGVMEQIERDAITQENEWIQQMNREDDEDDETNDTPRAGAIWRAF